MNNFLELIEKNKERFDIYYQSLVSYNEKVNLTAITKKEDVYIKHFLDSVLGVNLIKQNAKLVDVGTGAGFPSLPIKIIRPDIDLTMVDSLNKRVVFLNEVCNKLNIKANCVHARAEDFAKNNREKFDVAVARAVARLNTLLEYLLPLVKISGIVVAYKGSNFSEELTEAQNAIKKLGGEFVEVKNFNLPNDAGERNLIVIKKIKPTPNEYPRGQNKPKTNPII